MVLRFAMTVAIVLCTVNCAAAATMTVYSDHVIVSGQFVRGDDEQFAEILKANPDLKTVILYDSPGGNGFVMQRMSALIRGHGLVTGVAGYCISACAMIFLSGVQRYFTDMVPVQNTSLGFHGSYRPDGTLAPETRLQMIKGMIMDETGGKADPALVDHWTHLDSERSTVRFTYPGTDGTPKGTTVYECSGQGRFPDYRSCTPLAGHDALSMGIITSTSILHVYP
jgi:hypothetical protein